MTAAPGTVSPNGCVVKVTTCARRPKSPRIPAIRRFFLWAAREQRILVTIDSDFGLLVFHRNQPHTGIVRLPDVPAGRRILRLRLAQRLLNPDTGVLIVTIDEHEVHHLGMLLEAVFPNSNRQLVTIVINQKGVAQERLSRAEEYALFCFNPGVTLAAHHDDLLSPDRADAKRFQTPRWEWLLRGGANSRREDRPGLFFPVMVDPKLRKIVAIGDPLPLSEAPDLTYIATRRIAWPLRTDGMFGRWRVSLSTLRHLLTKGYVKLGGFDEARGTWTILYLAQPAQNQIDAGAIEIIGRDAVTG